MVKPTSSVSPYPPSFPSTSSGTAPPVKPTWTGFIHTTHDALVIVEGCLQGKINHIARRPHDRERPSLIASGNVFVYEENASGIKRWTDGMTWSPSRIMGNFLVYRELAQPWPQGQKKVAQKRKRSAENIAESAAVGLPDGQNAEEDRRLVGSLVDSYGFKPNGLVKRTLTITYHGIAHHVISYYKVSDIKNGNFHRPGFDQNLMSIVPRPELINNTQLKFPINDPDEVDPFPAQGSSATSVAQQIFPSNYSVHQPQSFSQSSNLSVQPPYDLTHYPGGSNLSQQAIRSNSAVSLSSYPVIPISDGAINSMTSCYAQTNGLTLQTANSGMPFKSEYGSTFNDSGMSTPDNSTGHSVSALSFDSAEHVQSSKRQRADASSNPVTLPTPTSIGSEFDHNHDPMGDAACWAYDEFSPAGLAVSLPFGPSMALYHSMPTNLMQNSQLWSTHINMQQYSI